MPDEGSPRGRVKASRSRFGRWLAFGFCASVALLLAIGMAGMGALSRIGAAAETLATDKAPAIEEARRPLSGLLALAEGLARIERAADAAELAAGVAAFGAALGGIAAGDERRALRESADALADAREEALAAARDAAAARTAFRRHSATAHRLGAEEIDRAVAALDRGAVPAGDTTDAIAATPAARLRGALAIERAAGGAAAALHLVAVAETTARLEAAAQKALAATQELRLAAAGAAGPLRAAIEGMLTAGARLASLRAREIRAAATAPEAAARGARALRALARTAGREGDLAILAAEIAAADIERAAARARLAAQSATVIGLVALCGAFLVIRRRFALPLSALTRRARALSGGDLSPVEGFGRREGGLGEIAAALSSFREARLMLRDLEGHLRRMLARPMGGARSVSGVGRSLGESAEAINIGVGAETGAARQVAGALADMNAGLQTMAETAAASEAVARDLADTARRSGRFAQEALEGLSTIIERAAAAQAAARRMDALALGAALEAARAGEAAPGVAAIATELRALADQTLESSDEIRALAARALARTKTGIALLDEIAPGAESAKGLIRRLTSGARTQRIGAAQIDTAIRLLSDVIEGNIAAARAARETAQDLAFLAQDLLNTIEDADQAVGDAPGAAEIAFAGAPGAARG